MSELIEHTVIVDEHITVQMKIPKELDALALKGLMLKANKLMSLGEVTLQTKKPARNQPVKNGKFDWTQKRVSELQELAKTSASAQEGIRLFANKHGVSVGATQAKYYSSR
jgi:hypothetical protein